MLDRHSTLATGEELPESGTKEMLLLEGWGVCNKLGGFVGFEAVSPQFFFYPLL